MPYTPPSHSRSPANSAPTSPDASRRPSFQSRPRPSLPRSASYLTKTRRTPSAVGGGNDTPKEPTPPNTSDDLKSLATSASVRQSPPPVTGERGIPNGAVISPPDSASSGSDEEDGGEDRRRNLSKLEELKDAISQIPVQRTPSPPPKADRAELRLPTQLMVASTSRLSPLSTSGLDVEARNPSPRRSHSRSATEPKVRAKSAENSLTGSEEESEEELLKKPPMVRKKSGELVRPALRPPSRRRPSSMPGTPTFSKTVHFDSHLEHVRHFLQVDRPLAVSAGSSPVDNYDSDTEYPFPGQGQDAGTGGPVTRSPPFEWEISLANRQVNHLLAEALPVRLEKVWLSPDQKLLLGSVSVANLAFQKCVICRFTFDYWKTTSEVGAEYSHPVGSKDTTSVGRDRFTFAIKLSDLAHLETKTLYFCIRYNVLGEDFWDNNGGTNFQVDFRKKHLPQNGKRGMQGAASRPPGGLPRSSRRPSPAGTQPRPKSMPAGFDEFGDEGKFNFDQPIHEVLGESDPVPLRIKTKSTNNLAADNLVSRLPAPSGLAFANRYDFGASLTAAVQAAKDSMAKDRLPEGLYMKSHRDINVAPEPAGKPTQSGPSGVSSFLLPPPDSATTSAAPGNSSPNTLLASSSYEELVNKYCFFGSKQSSPQLKEGTLKAGRFDGAGDGSGTRGSNSSNSSGVGTPKLPLHAGPAQHHAIRFQDPAGSYFRDAGIAIGASPAESPLKPLLQSSSDRSDGKTTHAHASRSGTPSSMKSASPPPVAGGYPHLAGTSPGASFAQQVPERFLLFSNEAHSTTAIRG